LDDIIVFFNDFSSETCFLRTLPEPPPVRDRYSSGHSLTNRNSILSTIVSSAAVIFILEVSKLLFHALGTLSPLECVVTTEIDCGLIHHYYVLHCRIFFARVFSERVCFNDIEIWFGNDCDVGPIE
jgi:hypothetical protein